MRGTTRLWVTAGLALVLLGTAAVRPLGRPGQSGPIEPSIVPASALLGGPSAGRSVAALQERLREVPSDWRALAALGLAYVGEARTTADPTWYPKAERALSRSLALRPDNPEALVGMASLSLARHDFREALRWAERAASVDGHSAAVLGVLGDAHVELGRYAEGFRAIQTMVEQRPDLASYARASYALELQGRIGPAIRAMRMARAAAGSPADAAWASHQLGELLFSVGRVGAAERAYREAVRLASSWPSPRAGLARVAWARGRVGEAERRLRRVVERYPAPEHVATLGDLYAVTGRPRLAEQQYALVRAEQALFRANGVNVDIEVALFDADHGRRRDALEAARAEWRRRRSVQAADALAWALHANGRDREAARFASRALRLGSMNPLFLFHAGKIRLALGDEDGARRLLRRALRINPAFSILHAEAARAALAGLEEAR